jgi:hypothetical protein
MSSVNIGEPNHSAIRAIGLKVVRASDQTKVLANLQTQYVDTKPRPYRILRAVKADFTEHVYYLRYDVPIPLEFSILLGEIVHNLRSALDQCIFQLALNHTGIEHDKTMFPVFTSLGDFRKHGAWRIRDVGDSPRAFIRSLQPYPERSLPVHHSLLDLNNLSNADKHRIAHLWGLSFGFGETKIVTGAALIPTGLGKILHDGAEICRIVPELPTDKMQVRGSLQATLSIDNPTAARRGVSTNLWNIIADVKSLTGALLGALGQQTEPINVDWPTHESLVE